MIILGVLSVVLEVMQVIVCVVFVFVEIDVLVEKIGELVLCYMGVEDSYIILCVLVGIVIVVVVVIIYGEWVCVVLMLDSSGMVNEVVMLCGYNVDYGVLVISVICFGGGCIVEVGVSNLVVCW